MTDRLSEMLAPQHGPPCVSFVRARHCECVAEPPEFAIPEVFSFPHPRAAFVPEMAPPPRR